MKLIPIQPFQETLGANACSPATLKMLLTYWNLPGKEKADLELAKELDTNDEIGTSNEAFIGLLPNYGLTATVKTEGTFEDIAAWLEKGVPVVVDWLTPIWHPEHNSTVERPHEAIGYQNMPDGHHSIVVGLDEKNIYLQDPEAGGLRTIPRLNFWRIWFDFTGDWIEKKDDLVLRWMAAVYPTQNTY